MYTQEDYDRLKPENFDFSNFNWKAAKADYLAWVAYRKGKGDRPVFPNCRAQARLLHVTRCLAFHTMVERIEVTHSRSKLRPGPIRHCIDRYHVDGTPEERRAKLEKNRVVVVEILPSLAEAIGMTP